MDCFDGLLGMHRGDRGHNNSLQAGMLQHFIVIRVDLDARGLEMHGCPFQLYGKVWGKDGY